MPHINNNNYNNNAADYSISMTKDFNFCP